MTSKVFFDAHILFDFTLKRESFPIVRQLFGKIVAGEISAYISPSIVHIAGYWLTKAYGPDKAKNYSYPC